ncbi:MAG TPA: glycosyltransferase [Allosphingosinicella sp.]|jgi:glycosyltransferase involved in cell wall biosynthesis
MLRVLAVSTRYPDAARPGLGGFVERQMRELARRPGFEVEIVAPIRRSVIDLLNGGRALARVPAEEEWNGLRVHRPRFTTPPRLPRWTPWTLARRLVPLARRVRDRYPFDLVSAEFSWPEGPAAIAIGKAFGIPVSIKARGFEFILRADDPATHPPLLAAARAAAGLLAVGGDLRAIMAQHGVPAERIETHYPAVDMEMFRPRNRAEAKRALGISGPLLLTVGNLIPVKQQHLAIDALAHLEGAVLMMVGGGPEAAALRRRAAGVGVSGRVQMLGSVPQAVLPEIYAAADVTIHPSRIEGFANVRLESLACGTPLITTAVGDAARLIRSPSHGRLVPPEPFAIARAVRDLLASPRDPWAVREAVRDFSWQRSTDQLERYFLSLIGG